MYQYLGAAPIDLTEAEVRRELEYGAGFRHRPATQVLVATAVFGVLYLAFRKRGRA